MRPKKTIGRNARQTPFCRVAAIYGLVLRRRRAQHFKAWQQIGAAHSPSRWAREPLLGLNLGATSNSAHARASSGRTVKLSGRADSVEEACDFGFEILRPRRQPLRPAADFLN